MKAARGIRHATLIARDIDSACSTYVEQLGLRVGVAATLDAETARVLDLVDHTGTPLRWLHNTDNEPILRLIECPDAISIEPMQKYGWLALEILVADVDALIAKLRAPFRVLGPPADLEISPNIRASQVLGPCGELIYFTQVKAPLAPFDLPLSADHATVAHTFVGVIATPDRAATVAAWEALTGNTGIQFETKITVLNRALGRTLTDRYAVAVVALPGRCLIEIDEVELVQFAAPVVFLGLHCVALNLKKPMQTPPVGWRSVSEPSDVALGSLRGVSGEMLEIA
jgi:catechol 2,3-dioxygenase-like lactoylglutathione lyase family enzyme